jgi:hypothetical protein
MYTGCDYIQFVYRTKKICKNIKVTATQLQNAWKLLRFISDDVWGSKGVCRVISRSISAYLVQAWDVRNSCKHNGAVLPLSAAPVGRGADGVDAMA